MKNDNHVKKVFLGISFCITIFVVQGCSVFMAANQPPKLDTSLFKIGTPREQLLVEFGVPLSAEEKDGKKYEIFKFTQGYGAGAKTGRALLHGTADVFTLGLWEVVGTPTEAIFNGTPMAYQVSYDEKNLVDSFVVLKQK